MSTTPVENGSASHAVGTTPIDQLRRRRHLDRLLDSRAQLAILASERHSHRLDDASQTYLLQLSVETEIQNEFPDVYEAKFPDWVRQDAEADHPTGYLSPECGICRAVAVSRGLNLERPTAA